MKMNRFKKMMMVGTIVAMSIFGTGCAKKEVVEVKPNEIAYEITNFGNDETQKFDGTRAEWSSIKATSKMIIVNFKKIRLGGVPVLDTKKIPEKKIAVVSQATVSKEWVAGAQKGTSSNDDSFSAGSNQGAEFIIGITTEARIADTDTYISIYGVDPKSTINDVRVEALSLSTILDRTVKPYIQGKLSEEFGNIPTGECQQKMNEVIAKVSKDVKARFLKDGIEIRSFNVAGNLTWKDSNIQNAIDETARLLVQKDKAIAQQEVDAKQAETKRIVSEQQAMANARKVQLEAESEKQKAEQERLAQVERNQMALEKVENERKMALENAKSDREVANEKSKILDTSLRLAKIERYKAQTEAIRLKAKADLVSAERWDGVREGSNAQIIGASSVVGTDGSVKTVKLAN